MGKQVDTEELEQAVKVAIEDGFGAKLSDIKITENTDEDFDNELFVVLRLCKRDEALTGQWLMSLRRAAIRAVQETGETRYPIIFSKPAAGQRIDGF